MYDIIAGRPDLVVEAAGPIEAVKLVVELPRQGTRWNVFGITMHGTSELDGWCTHFVEGRMDASRGDQPVGVIVNTGPGVLDARHRGRA